MAAALVLDMTRLKLSTRSGKALKILILIWFLIKLMQNRPIVELGGSRKLKCPIYIRNK